MHYYVIRNIVNSENLMWN